MMRDQFEFIEIVNNAPQNVKKKKYWKKNSIKKKKLYFLGRSFTFSNSWKISKSLCSFFENKK